MTTDDQYPTHRDDPSGGAVIFVTAIAAFLVALILAAVSGAYQSFAAFVIALAFATLAVACIIGLWVRGDQ